MTVLVVDDTSILRSILRDILVEYCGVSRRNIFEAADGMQALAEYKRLKPDIVYLDIAMPNLNGIETVRKILAIDPNAKIVMCTGSGGESVVKECVRAGAMDYLVKPLSPSRVAVSVEKATGGKIDTESIREARRQSHSLSEAGHEIGREIDKDE